MKRPVLTRKVYTLLLHRLASGAWSQGSRCPSVRELAREMRMSRRPIHEAFQMAVSNRLLAAHSRRRTVVLPGAGRRAAALLEFEHQTGPRRAVAVLLPEQFFPLRGAPFQVKLSKAVAAAAAARGWESHLIKIPQENQFRLAQKVMRQFDAAFVVDTRKLAVLFALAEYGIPLLTFNQPIPGIDRPVLTTNDYGACQQLGRLMVERGHRNICFVTTSKYEYLDDPRSASNGWLEFVRRTGLEASCTMSLAYYKSPDVFPELMEQLLRLRPRITGYVMGVPPNLAFLGGDDRFRDLRIPGDISLAAMSSVHGIPWPSRHPRVTSFEVDWDRAGHCAIEMLELMLAGDAHPKSIRVPMNMQLTESIGPPSASA